LSWVSSLVLAAACVCNNAFKVYYSCRARKTQEKARRRKSRDKSK